MKLDTSVKIAEIISAVAVIVTLIILVYEVRNNTESNRALVYGQEMDRLNSIRFAELNNPELTELNLLFRSGDLSKLSETQQQRLRRFLGAQWSIYESAFFQYQVGHFGEVEWSRYDDSICRQYARAKAAELWVDLTLSMTRQFSDFVVGNCDA